MNPRLVDCIRRQLVPTLEMMNRVTKTCPPGLWAVAGPTTSIRNRVVHAAESLDFWIGDTTSYLYPALDPRPMRPRLHDDLPDAFSMQATRQYYRQVAVKTLAELEKLDDAGLLEVNARTGVPTISLFLGQIRHVQVNVGYCNEFLASRGVETVGWIGSTELPGDFAIE